MTRRPTISTRTATLSPYTTLFRAPCARRPRHHLGGGAARRAAVAGAPLPRRFRGRQPRADLAVPAAAGAGGAGQGAGALADHRPAADRGGAAAGGALPRSEEHTSELQSLMRISYAVFCLKTKK